MTGFCDKIAIPDCPVRIKVLEKKTNRQKSWKQEHYFRFFKLFELPLQNLPVIERFGKSNEFLVLRNLFRAITNQYE